MALSNCRSNGQGLRLRYRLEVFGYANDDRCASGAASFHVVGRKSVAVHAVATERWSSIGWTLWRLADAVIFRCEHCKSAGGLLLATSLSAVWTLLQTWKL